MRYDMELDYQEIGRRIAKRRRELGYKQAQVEELAGIGYKYLSSIERGISIPSGPAPPGGAIPPLGGPAGALSAFSGFFRISRRKRVFPPGFFRPLVRLSKTPPGRAGGFAEKKALGGAGFPRNFPLFPLRFSL